MLFRSKLLKETFFERIQNRFSRENAVEIITELQRAKAQDTIDYMAVKEASEMVERYKLHAKLAIRAYRRWRTRMAMRQLHRATLDQEGRLLREAARSASSLYLDARRDWRDLQAMAIAEFQDEPANDA